MDNSIKKQREEKLYKKLWELFPSEIENEVGVGRFRVNFHRTYTAGDGWMTGDTKTYFIVEVFNSLFKISSYFNDEENPKFSFHHESGGSSRLDTKTKRLYKSQIKNYEVSQARRKEGTLYDSLK